MIKPRGVIALTSSGLFTAKLMLHAADLYKYKLVWIKSKATNFLNAKKQPLRKYEDICIFYQSQPTYHPQTVSYTHLSKLTWMASSSLESSMDLSVRLLK